MSPVLPGGEIPQINPQINGLASTWYVFVAVIVGTGGWWMPVGSSS